MSIEAGPKLISDPTDLAELGIINWDAGKKPDGEPSYFPNQGIAQRVIFSHFNRRAYATVLRVEDYYQAPEYPGYEWRHAGLHEEQGRYLWNWFHWKHPGWSLRMSDSPDLEGEIPDTPTRLFWGDIGRVAAYTFCGIQKVMGRGDIWLSVQSDRHVMIETIAPINELWGAEKKYRDMERKMNPARGGGKYTQVGLF